MKSVLRGKQTVEDGPLERLGSNVRSVPIGSGPPASQRRSGAAALGLGQLLWHDKLLRIAFLLLGLFIAYQLIVTLLHPAWIGAGTDWFRAGLAWPQLAVVISVSVWFTRVHRSIALSWWFFSAAMLSYTIARNLWTIDDR